MSWTKEQTQIYQGLNMIMKACGLDGETGTEALFAILQCATDAVSDQWDAVAQSHRDGLAYDVNAMLAREIAKATPLLEQAS